MLSDCALQGTTYLTFPVTLSQNALQNWSTCMIITVGIFTASLLKKTNPYFCLAVPRALDHEQCHSLGVWLGPLAGLVLQCTRVTAHPHQHREEMSTAKAYASILPWTSWFSFWFLSLIPQEMPIIGIIYDSVIHRAKRIPWVILLTLVD